MAITKTSLVGIKTVVFDFDGTLGHLNIDFSLIRQEITALAVDYGADPDAGGTRYVLEMILALQENLALKGSDRAERFYHEAMAIVARSEMESARRGSLIPGTMAMLEELKRRGLGLGVVTRNCLDAISVVFPGIDDFFGAAVITRERTKRFKPHPEHLLTALAQLGGKPETSLMAGDHPMDIQIGKATGCVTLGVLTGYSSRDDLARAGADCIAASVVELPSLIRN